MSEEARVVGISLGSSTRDKATTVELGGRRILVERRGVDGDTKRFNQLVREHDGQCDVICVGGTEMNLRIGPKIYEVLSTRKLLEGLAATPAVDGCGVKATLERRVFDLAADDLGDTPRYPKAMVNLAADRWGMATAVAEVTDEVAFGDLAFGFGIPVALRSLGAVERIMKMVLPIGRRIPVSWVYPTGEAQTKNTPKFAKLWDADLVAGDFLYHRRYAPEDLSGKTMVTNTTTADDIDWLARRGLATLVTTTPRFDGRSFGTNVTEGILTAYAGATEPLRDEQLNALIDELRIRPDVRHLT